MSKKTSKTTEPEKKQTKYDRKMEARRKEAQRQKRDAMIFRIVCIIIAIALIGTAGYFGVKQYLDYHAAISESYVSVGEHELTKFEYDYYFNTTVNNYLNTYSSLISYIGLDTTKPFDEQEYSEEMTWQEYFEQMTLEQLKQEFALLDDAKANGFEYDTTEDYNDFIDNAKETATNNKMSLRSYYKVIFGDYATLNNVKPLMEDTFIASAYYEKLTEDNTPDDAAVSDYYEEHKAEYDKVTYYSFFFNPSDYPDETTTSTLADEMLERVESGEDFETLCAEYAPDDKKSNYESEDSEYSLTKDVVGNTVNQTFRSWMTDESRKKDDTTVITSSDTGTSYVLKFVNRTYDESCTDTISSTLANNAVTEYVNALMENNYEITDMKGEISYLKEDTEADNPDSSSDTSSDSESLLDTSIIE